MAAVDPLIRDVRRRLETRSFAELADEIGLAAYTLRKLEAGHTPGRKVLSRLGWRAVYRNGSHVYEAAEVRVRLERLVADAGSVLEASRRLGVSSSQLWRALRAPTPEPCIVRALSLTVAYRQNRA